LKSTEQIEQLAACVCAGGKGCKSIYRATQQSSEICGPRGGGISARWSKRIPSRSGDRLAQGQARVRRNRRRLTSSPGNDALSTPQGKRLDAYIPNTQAAIDLHPGRRIANVMGTQHSPLRCLEILAHVSHTSIDLRGFAEMSPKKSPWRRSAQLATCWGLRIWDPSAAHRALRQSSLMRLPSPAPPYPFRSFSGDN
jgi:hypothetical protein